jgi:hypothetical protein
MAKNGEATSRQNQTRGRRGDETGCEILNGVCLVFWVSMLAYCDR